MRDFLSPRGLMVGARASGGFDTIHLFTLIFFPADDLSPGLGNFQDLYVY